MGTSLTAFRLGSEGRFASDSAQNISGNSKNGFSARGFLRVLLDPNQGIGAELDAGQRAALAALVEEPDEGIFWRDLLSWGGRLELGERYGAAAALYAAAAEAAREPAVKARAQSRLDAILGSGRFGSRCEILLRRFARDACDPKVILPMLVGSAVYGLTRTATLSRLTATAEGGLVTRGWGARLAASSAGFFAEVPAFALSARGMRRALGGAVAEPETSVGQDLAGAAITLGFLKTASFLGREGPQALFGIPVTSRLSGGMRTAQFALGQGTMFFGLMVAHRIEEQVGLRAHVEGATLMTDTLAAMIGLSVGARLGRSLLGRSLLSWEGEAAIRDRPPASGEAPWLAGSRLQVAFSATGSGPVRGGPLQEVQPGLASAMGLWDRVKNFVSEKKAARILADRREQYRSGGLRDPQVKAELELIRKAEGYRVKAVSPEERERILQMAADSGIHPEIFLARYLTHASSPEVEGWMEVLFPDDWGRRILWIDDGNIRGGAKFITDILRLPRHFYLENNSMLNTLVQLGARESLPVLKKISAGFEQTDIQTRPDKYQAAMAVLQLEGGDGIRATFHKLLNSDKVFRNLHSTDSDYYEWEMRRALAEVEFKRGSSTEHVLEILSGGRSYAGLLRISRSDPVGLFRILGRIEATEPLVHLWTKLQQPTTGFAPPGNNPEWVQEIRSTLRTVPELAKALLQAGQEAVMLPKVRKWVKESSYRILSLDQLEVLTPLAEPDVAMELLNWRAAAPGNGASDLLTLAGLFGKLGEVGRAREMARPFMERERSCIKAAALMDNLAPGWDRFIKDLYAPPSGPYR